ncbi:MAG: protein-export chaperone SecB [Aquabacterium sp.]|jgi:preprotein translocase subunit SecB|uniref:protein-export chaperone SecB n=1 Tax=Aquabacterium sp. TaxID=1872578 RepID=UPI003BB10041
MSDQAQPSFNIQRIYLKDLSVELPNAPQIFLEQGNPNVDVQLNLNAENVNENGIFEVTVSATVTTKVNDKVLFLVEAKQAGLFEIRNVPEDQLQPIIAIACPQIVYPYLRATVADAINRTGFPPVHLTEVNFQAMYQAQLDQAAQAQGAAGHA